MNRSLCRFVDLSHFYTKEILLKVLTDHMNLVCVNKKETIYTFLCPFHKEKISSFKMYKVPYGWGFKCLGCGRAGNVFTFLMLFLRVPFWKALWYVKKRYQHFFLFPIPENQLRIPFPEDGQGNFIWVSADMRQTGFV